MAHHKKEEHHKKHREGHEHGEHYKHGGRAHHHSHTGVEHRKSQNHDDMGKTEIAYGNEDVIHEAKKTKDAFKHGGKVHEGKKHKHHMGKHKFARGGRAKHSGSPFSHAHLKGIKGDAR